MFVLEYGLHQTSKYPGRLGIRHRTSRLRPPSLATLLPRYVKSRTVSIVPSSSCTGELSMTPIDHLTAIPFVFLIFTVSPHLRAVLTNPPMACSKASHVVAYTAASSANWDSVICELFSLDFVVRSPTSFLPCS